MRKAHLACLLCILLPIKANSQELPDVNRLVSEVILRAALNDEAKRRYLQFTKQEIVRDMNKTGADGKPKIEHDSSNRRGAGLKNDVLKLNPNDISPASHLFEYTVPYLHLDKDGRKYYQINFRPKKVHQDGKNEFVKAANRCQGTLEIDAEHLYMIRLNGEMPESEGFSAWGLFKLKWVKIEINQTRRSDLMNIVVIDSVISQVQYRIQTLILGAIHSYKQYEYRYSDYRYVE